MVSRRQFLRGRFSSGDPPRRPPWALAESLFLDACTRCGACAPVCPTTVISLASGYPEIDFSRGECTFCGECAQACRHGALRNGEPRGQAWAIKARPRQNCLPMRGVECRICGDACSVAAIRFSPRVGGPPLPEVDDRSCTGCGACVAPCPVRAIAIA